MSDELQKYYKEKAKAEIIKLQPGTKKPLSSYEYDDAGNLVERKGREIVKTIPLPHYRSIMVDEKFALEQERKDAIAQASKAFDDARMALHAEYHKAEPSEYAIHQLNEAVELADLQLLQVRFPLQHIESNRGVQIRQLDFSQMDEIRKYPYAVAILETSPFQLTDLYTREGEPGSRPFVSLAEARKMVIDPAIVFDNMNPNSEGYGFLSLSWPVEMEYEGTLYHSARQALFAEMAKSFGDEAHRQIIMAAEKPEDIHYVVDDVPDTTDAAWNTTLENLIQDVNLQKFILYPELAGRLLETRNAPIGAYEPDDNTIGTGIPLNSLYAKNPLYWTGQNLQGKALELIREVLRQQKEEQQSQVVVQPKSARRVRRMVKIEENSEPQPIQAGEGLYYQDRLPIDGAQIMAQLDTRMWTPVTDSASSRRVQQYGFIYDYKARRVSKKTEDIPEFLVGLQTISTDSCLKLGIIQEGYVFNQCLVNEYQPSQGINAHTDAKDYGAVIGCFTLGSGATMTFKQGATTESIYVKPNSLYIMSGNSRYTWTHEMPSRKSNMVAGVKIIRERRVSVTFRNVPDAYGKSIASAALAMPAAPAMPAALAMVQPMQPVQPVQSARPRRIVKMEPNNLNSLLL